MGQFVFILPKTSLLVVSLLFVLLNVICMDLTTVPRAYTWAYADRPTKKGNLVWYPVLFSHIIIYSLQKYDKNKLLKNFFRIVSTSKDRKGIEFISTMEGI